MGKKKDKKQKHKKERKQKKEKKAKHSSSESESTSEDEWVEKSAAEAPKEREDWFSLPANFLTASTKEQKESRRETKRLEKQKEQYNPGTSVRELNPYWKDNGSGLPSSSQFKKPPDDDNLQNSSTRNHKSSSTNTSTRNWRKTSTTRDKDFPETSTPSKRTSDSEEDHEPSHEQEESEKILSQKELNALAAKLIKAEIMANEPLIKQLKEKLENARKIRQENPQQAKQEDVILTQTDSKGFSRPLKSKQDSYPANSKKQKLETHDSHGERSKYFADDDKFSLKEMFEEERFNTAEKQNEEFLSILGKGTKNDDLDEIFTDKIRRKDGGKEDRSNRDRAIAEHQKMSRSLDKCKKCPGNLNKHLLITHGTSVYLSVPSHEPLTEGHCQISSTRHVISSTQLDENEWEDVQDYRKSLVKMFASRGEDVIFFEVARYFHRLPHMTIHCIPLDREIGDLAPIYFKKAIDESETEWATNKKLIKLEGRNVRRAVPQGLPYFFVSFGMQEGFAHVIEDEEGFPANFAQEIIGGMLDLHHSKWRNPKGQSFQEQADRVKEFTKLWAQYDHNK